MKILLSDKNEAPWANLVLQARALRALADCSILLAYFLGESANKSIEELLELEEKLPDGAWVVEQLGF